MKCIILLMIILFVVFLLANRERGYKYSSKKDNPKINYFYSSKEGDFLIRGTKNNFTIKKNDRFTFRVLNGQIVSVKDKYKKCR